MRIIRALSLHMIVNVHLDVLHREVPFASGDQHEVVVEPASGIQNLISIISLVNKVSLQIVEVFVESNFLINVPIHLGPNLHHMLVIFALLLGELLLEAQAQQSALFEIFEDGSVLIKILALIIDMDLLCRGDCTDDECNGVLQHLLKNIFNYSNN